MFIFYLCLIIGIIIVVTVYADHSLVGTKRGLLKKCMGWASFIVIMNVPRVHNMHGFSEDFVAAMVIISAFYLAIAWAIGSFWWAISKK